MLLTKFPLRAIKSSSIALTFANANMEKAIGFQSTSWLLSRSRLSFILFLIENEIQIIFMYSSLMVNH